MRIMRRNAQSCSARYSLSFLFAARCPSPGSCWTVGVQAHAGGNYQDEILHWNGQRWSPVTA
jgi:hypothetical protein